MSTYFKIDDLQDGWAVTWPGFEQRFCNTEHKIKTLLAVLFDDIGLWEAQLGVQPWHSVLDPAKAKTEYLSRLIWHRNPEDVVRYLMQDLMVVGVRFDLKQQARQFVDCMQQRLMWERLGGTWS